MLSSLFRCVWDELLRWFEIKGMLDRAIEEANHVLSEFLRLVQEHIVSTVL